jgi:hypothetical protein
MFYFLFLCFHVCFVSCAILSYSLHIICVGKPLFVAVIAMLFSSCLLFVSVMGRELILFVKYL